MSIPTSPHLNGPRARGFTCKPLQHKTCASSLSHARSLTQRPTRPSAYTVPGRAQDFHPHSLKRAHSSLTPASCPTQPSLPITLRFYHVLHGHVQKRLRMWHSSAAPTHAAVGTFCFPRSKSRQRKRIRKFCDIAPEKSQTCHIRAPFYTKVLISWHPTISTQEVSPQRAASNNTPLKRPIPKARHPIPRASPSRQKKPPHKRGAAFYKTMRSFNRAWVQPSQAFDQERARREIYSAASSVAGFSALGAAAFFLG